MGRLKRLVTAAVSTIALFVHPVYAWPECAGSNPVPLYCSSDLTRSLEGSVLSQLGGTCEASECYGCDGLEQEGPEHVYSFTPQTTGDVMIVLETPACDLDLYVLDGICDPFSACVAAEASSDPGDVELTYTAVAGNQYFVVVEGSGFWRDTCGTASASYRIRLETGGGCPEHCANGIDDDRDGDADCSDTDCLPDCAVVSVPIIPASGPASWGQVKTIFRR